MTFSQSAAITDLACEDCGIAHAADLLNVDCKIWLIQTVMMCMCIPDSASLLGSVPYIYSAVLHVCTLILIII